LGITILSIT